MRVSPVAMLRQVVSQHFKKHLVVYVPALLPLVFFFLAHGMTLLTLIFIKSGVMQGYLMPKTVVTWAVYGFLPLLLCSYGCFFAVARPVTNLLERKFLYLSATMLTLAAGAAYGAAIGMALFLLLEPGTVLNALFLLGIGMATGLGNWFLYRKLTFVATEAE